MSRAKLSQFAFLATASAATAAAIAGAGCGKVNAPLADGGGGAVDARPADASTVPTHMIASSLEEPNSHDQAVADGIDLDGDAVPDNQMGNILTSLLGQGFTPQAAVDRAVARGDILLLADYEPAAATFTLFKGATPTPAPCASQDDPTCGHHLTGAGAFTIAGDSHHDVPLAGSLAATTFTGGPGSLTIPLAFAADGAFQVTLIGARVRLDGVSDGSFATAILAGAITTEDVDGHLVPALAAALQEQVAADCSDLTAQPTCGCASGSHGEKWIQSFDSTPDCHVMPDEVLSSSIGQTVLAPDVTIAGVPGVSVGVRITAAKAAFTP